jgi:hypothetical protein
MCEPEPSMPRTGGLASAADAFAFTEISPPQNHQRLSSSALPYSRLRAIFPGRINLGRKRDVKAAHAIIAWTPASSKNIETCGQVLVGQWVPRTAPGWALKYANLAGATKGVRRSMSEAEALQALGRDYADLVRAGLKHDVIDAAFSVIDGWTDRKSRMIG